MALSMHVRIFQDLDRVPAWVLHTLRRSITHNHCLLPMERVRDDDDRRRRMLVVVQDDSDATTVLTIVFPMTTAARDRAWVIEHLCSTSPTHAAAAVCCALLPLARRAGVLLWVDAYHDDAVDVDLWQRLGFRGVSFHRRPTGDRLRMEWRAM